MAASLALPLLLGWLSLSLSPSPSGAVYHGPLQPEISNGTFHHFFVPDGDYEETEDPEKCQMLFKWLERSPCPVEEDRDSAVRDDFMIVKQQIEDAARVLEGIGRTISHDLDGEDSYGTYLRREVAQIGEAFVGVEKSLEELEGKFAQGRQTEQREEQDFHRRFLAPMHGVRSSVRETADVSSGLRDKQELISLIARSHGTRLSRLKSDYMNV
uniref:Fin bud initiation factor a n=2 Tax=Denticeps clupeoides TaxID=299321 RepID=A0AAY4CN70_9TELE